MVLFIFYYFYYSITLALVQRYEDALASRCALKVCFLFFLIIIMIIMMIINIMMMIMMIIIIIINITFAGFGLPAHAPVLPGQGHLCSLHSGSTLHCVF